MEYSYTGINKTGLKESGVLEAECESDLISLLQSENISPLSITAGKSAGLGALLPADLFADSGIMSRLKKIVPVSNKEALFEFTEKLSTMVNAGIPLADALTTLTQTTSDEFLLAVSRKLLQDVSGGTALSVAMKNHPKFFSNFYVNLVKSGEASGQLGSVLQHIKVHIAKSEKMKSFLISSLTYPAILMLVSIGTIVVLVAVVIPQFEEIFMKMNTELPAMTQSLISITDFFSTYGLLIVVMMVLGVMLFKRYASTEQGKLAIHIRLIGLPVLGSLIREIEINNFARVTGTLLKQGVPLDKTLSIVSGIPKNLAYVQAIEQLIQGVRTGESISELMRQSHCFTRLLVELVKIGEKTGKMAEMFEKTADYYDNNLQIRIKKLLAIFEPVIILFMFLITGYIVAAMLLAVTSLTVTT